jgi:hypothetical protein
MSPRQRNQKRRKVDSTLDEQTKQPKETMEVKQTKRAKQTVDTADTTDTTDAVEPVIGVESSWNGRSSFLSGRFIVNEIEKRTYILDTNTGCYYSCPGFETTKIRITDKDGLAKYGLFLTGF